MESSVFLGFFFLVQLSTPFTVKSLQSTQPAEYQTVLLANRIKKLCADFTAHVWPTGDWRHYGRSLQILGPWSAHCQECKQTLPFSFRPGFISVAAHSNEGRGDKKRNPEVNLQSTRVSNSLICDETGYHAFHYLECCTTSAQSLIKIHLI